MSFTDAQWTRIEPLLPDRLEWVVAVDSTIARAHQHAAGAR
ncbi:hypothetical protein ACIGXA_24705 [Streptomyces fildesensis]|uniref:Transposase n=1 Tax=Streptomyces fildesensis TaxID=375757 RepID=A0ABW8CBB7_9ACTN